MSGLLKVEAPGLSTTLQDLGRVGFQSLGLPVSGALDPIALRIANALVGNSEGQGALEIRFLGPTLSVEADAVRVALAGTQAPIEVLEPSRQITPAGRSVTLHRGWKFRIGAVADSGVCYLAVGGGFDAPKVFESQSTYVRGGLGGFEGRALQIGDSLPLAFGDGPTGLERAALRTFDYGNDGPIRVVLGPQAEYFTEAGLQTFLKQEFTVSREADRMGVRLDGPTIEHAKGFNIPSDGIVTGSIQVPGSGLPIVLLADRQTTGGYPKIAAVASSDLPRLGRMRPGATLRFAAIDVPEAEALRRAQEAQLHDLISGIRLTHGLGENLEDLLLSENLISGGEWATE